MIIIGGFCLFIGATTVGMPYTTSVNMWLGRANGVIGIVTILLGLKELLA